jgi:hypothetical protein
VDTCIGNKQAMTPKKCCYMERECTPACVAYTASNDLSECVKHGMSDMHCMRLLLDLADTMGMTGCNESEESIF